MNWREHIHSDLEVLMGKPLIKNTRLAVDFLLDLLAEGWSEKQILENYPSLTPESLHALFDFVAECMREEALYSFPAKLGNEIIRNRLCLANHSLFHVLCAAVEPAIFQRPANRLSSTFFFRRWMTRT